MYWLFGNKSQLSTENKLLLYKAILKPIWACGVRFEYRNMTKISKHTNSLELSLMFHGMSLIIHYIVILTCHALETR